MCFYFRLLQVFSSSNANLKDTENQYDSMNAGNPKNCKKGHFSIKNHQ